MSLSLSVILQLIEVRILSIQRWLAYSLIVSVIGIECTIGEQAKAQLANEEGESTVEEESPPSESEEIPTIRINLQEILQQARQAQQEGDLERAVTLYRLILRFQPNVDFVRIELAYVLTLIGERNEARNLLSDTDLSRIDPRILAFIIGRPRDRLGVFFLPEIFMDSNRDQQTDARTIQSPLGTGTLSSDARAQSGIGGRLLVGIIFNEELFENTELSILSSFRYDRFENRDFDEIQPFMEIELSRRFGRWQPAIAALGSYTRTGHEGEDEGSIGASLRLLYRGESFNVRTAATVRYFNGYRLWDNVTDRRLIEIRPRLSFGLFDSLSVVLSTNFSLTNWDDRDTQDNVTFEPGIRVTPVNVPWLTPTLDFSWRRRWNERRDTFFQVIRRDDQIRTGVELCLSNDITFDVQGTIGWILEKLKKVCARYSYTRNISNIDLYDYSRHEFGFRTRPLTW